MLRFVKGNLENIDGVAIYPIISILIFFTFFAALYWWVITAKKDHVDEMSNIPWDDDINQNTIEE